MIVLALLEIFRGQGGVGKVADTYATTPSPVNMPNDKGVSTNPSGKTDKGKEEKGKSTNPEPKSSAPPNLSRKFKFIRPVVETQCINLQQNVVKHNKTMRKMIIKIRD